MNPTRAFVVIVAVLSLALAVLAAPAAEALNRKPSTPRSASGQLRTELRRAQATLARATSELARLRGGVGTRTSQQQLSQVQRTLISAKKQMSIAAGRSAALHAQLAATPTPLGVAVEQVRREVAWARGGVASPRGQLVAEAAMDYTVGHVSTGAFGYLELVKGGLPGYRPNRILAAQAGICGQASWVFAAIARRFSLPVRSVVFSYRDPGGTADGHTAVEVSYDGHWHFFDPTFGQFWTDASGNVLSVGQIVAGLGTRVKDLASFTNVVENTWFGDDTWFITDPATQIQTGTLTLKG